MDVVTHKKLAGAGPLHGQDALRVVERDARGSYGALQGAPLRVRVLLDTTTGQDIRGVPYGVPDRGRRRRRPGEDAHRRGQLRSGSSAATAGRDRLDQGLEDFEGAGLGCGPGSSRDERGNRARGGIGDKAGPGA